MSNASERPEIAGAQRSLPLEAATPPLHPASMPPQAIVFWTPVSIFAEALHATKIVASRALRYQGRAYERATISVPSRDDRR